mmetsp:Transcript_13400/g.30043  ORF Transcript_13400/g.30043 Transcript_13400/m.30043 type:complete len:163 (+) Transcript_13400:200-688(+)
MENRADSCVGEFLEQQDVAEVQAVLAESPREMYGYIVLAVISRVLNATKEAVVANLLALLKSDALGPGLRAARPDVEAAVACQEELKCLVDTTIDIKQAPERIACVLAALAGVGAVDKSFTQRVLDAARKNCLTEMENTAEECEAVFSRFMSRYGTSATPAR